ncbi:MAG: hypothetical protein J6P66_06435 [Bacteroidaceae bacterium]|nr:hypothetical protein [Bacteroidaceae bacterium]
MKKKKLFIYAFILVVLFTFTGCIKDDNPYPDIVDTSWYRNEGENYQKLSFTDKNVTHIIYFNGKTKTFTFKYEGGDKFGAHFYSWINDNDGQLYKVYSYGQKHLLMSKEVTPKTEAFQYDKFILNGFYCFTKE